ncbi:hypothetical protein Q1695_010757 [Nippostrongylus brasiliensis]|nr:hypothetical protein Q1695_010757 [Nippostrongylus brasiliensis]
MDCSASSNEVRFSELFSLFDSAQEYFRDRDRDQRFNELLFEASQLPSKIRRIKISKAREKQRSSEKLKAIEHRLAEVTSRLKLMETECNAKRQLVLEYGENIKNHHHQYKGGWFVFLI